MKKDEENKMQQYREETKTERMLVFFSYRSENISLSKMKPGTSLLGQKTRMLKPERKIEICTYIKGKSETKEDQE